MSIEEFKVLWQSKGTFTRLISLLYDVEIVNNSNILVILSFTLKIHNPVNKYWQVCDVQKRITTIKYDTTATKES